MKRGALLLTLAVMILSALPVIALAANETDMSTVVTYTKDAPPTSNPEPEPPPTSPSATYEINIPATLALHEGRGELWFTANHMNINDGQSVVVSVDEKTELVDGCVTLKNEHNETVRVSPLLGNFVNGYDYGIYVGDPVAVFDNSSTSPVEWGLLTLIVYTPDKANAQSGTYTGTLHFKVSVVND